MAKVGFILLAHRHADRIAQLAETLTAQGSPVALHLDTKMTNLERTQIDARLGQNPNVFMVPSIPIEWGQWSIVEATIDAVKILLAKDPEITHLYNISGACIPLRPLGELHRFLDSNGADTDHIESITLGDRNWVKGGIEAERVELYHPFDWKKQRWLFDTSVKVQRLLGVKRRLPQELTFALGSQWWCLRRSTIENILNDTEFARYRRFFKRSWIPDESFFQTLARKHSNTIRTESLTFAKFDHFGSPFIFYDDHLQWLKELDAFFARKVWHGANDIYDYFADLDRDVIPITPKTRTKLSETLNRTIENAELDRTGLVSQFTKPTRHFTHFRTRNRYHVFVGFDQFKVEIATHYSASETIVPYGSIFNPKDVELQMSRKGRPRIEPNDKSVRNYAPEQYLQQLVWYNPHSEIAFTTKAHWVRKLARHIVADPNANIVVLKGAWILDLAKRNFVSSNRLINNARVQMARERQFLKVVDKPYRNAKITLIELGDWITNNHDAKNVMPEGFRPTQTKPNLQAIANFVHRLEAEGILLTQYKLEQLADVKASFDDANDVAE